MPYAPPHPEQSQPKPPGHVDLKPGHHPGHDHPAHLAHHWDSSVQQFEAGKLGMWLFLATEVLLFGGLFCAYAVWRGNHPELFKYGSQFLNTALGATNTAVLILSSLTMAWGVTAAQQNKQGLLKLMLILTLAGAATFLVIKYFEYTHKFHEGWYPGLKFYEAPSEHSATFWGQHEGTHPTTSQELRQQGGVSTPTGETPAHTPPRGATETPVGGGAGAGSDGGFEIETVSVTPTLPPDLPPVEATSIAPAKAGPRGLAAEPQLIAEPATLAADEPEAIVHPLKDPVRPANAHMFFNIYFMMTGLHGVHVLVGMIVITWLLIRTFKGHFGAEYFTPVDLGGLYWHVVDLIWIFLFPLFYLI